MGARLRNAATMLGIAALVGSAPWVGDAMGLAPVGPRELGTIVAVGLAICLVAIAGLDLAMVIASRRRSAGRHARTPT